MRSAVDKVPQRYDGKIISWYGPRRRRRHVQPGRRQRSFILFDFLPETDRALAEFARFAHGD